MSVGKLFHVLHAARDLDRLDDLYDRLFAPWHGMMERRHSPHQRRVGSLLVVADGVVEIAAPSDDPGAASGPIGRFVAKFGPRWHSIAWYCDDVAAAADRLRSAGVRVLGPGGEPLAEGPADGDVYTHPKDTAAQLELYQPPASVGGPQGSGPFPDPRFEQGWPGRWAAGANPAGVERLAWVTVVVGDLGRAVSLWTEGMGATLVFEGESALSGTKSAYVAVGTQTVVELATPTGPGPAASDLAAFGDTLHSVTFGVADLDATAAHLAALGIGVPARDDTTLVADPADTVGAAMAFSTWRVPGDPRHDERRADP